MGIWQLICTKMLLKNNDFDASNYLVLDKYLIIENLMLLSQKK